MQQRQDAIEITYKENPDLDIDFVISLPAGVGGIFISELESFQKAMTRFNQKIVLCWTMDNGIDSINLLKVTFFSCYKFIDHIIVVKNNYFGDDDNFYIWNNSNLRILLLSLGANEAVMPGLHARLTPYYKTLNFDESHIKDIMEKNSIKNQNTEGNNNYSGEPMPFFNIMNGDIEIMGSIKNRLKNWLDTMSATFKIADEKTKLGVFKEKCSKLIL